MPIVLPSGESLRISRVPLGIGGEGKVYRVANEGQKGIIAKIYNRLPDRERQEKLKAMISICNPVLMDACAWPIATLVDTNSGEICGFTMNEVVESEPLHHFYSPSWRKQNQPNASWDNLLQLSANLTAVFSVVHDLGIVIGDVNPNSVRVRKNGRVVLIDSDSFQLSHNGSLFKCRVGVPSFTPPELLSSNQSFDLIKRTTNHDLFGLSLLIFHVLFMGRHPFAGVFNGPGDTPIESHIREFRYAYAVDHKLRGLLPPPLSISPRLVASTEVAEVFENDFTQIGAVKGRTSSKRWFEVISTQRQRLARCKLNANHVYDVSVGNCIWCSLERKGLSFFESRMPATASHKTSESLTKYKPADLLPTKTEEAAWRRISAVSAEKNIIPTITLSTIQPRYGLTETERVSILRRSRLRLLLCLLAAMILLMGQIALMPLIVILLVACFGYSPKPIRELIAKYKAELAQVEADVTGLKTSWHSLANDSKQTHIISTAQTAWSTIQSLKDQFDKEIAYKLDILRQRHKDFYLRSWLIADAGISGIGPGRSSTLASYGIESAADIYAERLYGISGFGPVLTSSLLAWKAKLISGYQPPSDDRILKGEERALLARYMKTRRQASADLQLAIETFDEDAKETKRLRAGFESRIIKSQQLAASIKADINQLKQPASSIFKDKYWYLIF
jgi:DNA-binding helix-hairpin-helix protein with protein kinase domain